MKKSKKILLIVLVIALITLIIGVSYALWTVNFSPTKTNVATYTCFKVTYTQETTPINEQNSYPISDEEGLKTDPYIVTINNTCSYPVTYDVLLNEMKTNTLDVRYIKIALNNNISLLNKNKQTTTSLSDADTAWKVSGGVLGANSTKKINVQAWIDETTTTTQGLNKKFDFKITINTIAGSQSTNQYLANAILQSYKLMTATPDFTKGEPITETYKEVVTSDKTYTTNLSSSIAGNKVIGTGYTFNKETHTYTLTGTSSNQTYNNNAVGKYTCNSTSTTCSSMYKIKAVDTTTDYFDEGSWTSYTSTATSSSNKAVGTGYTFSPSSGQYTLTGTQTGVSYSTTLLTSSPKYQYTCNSSSTSCFTLYKIGSVSGTTATFSQKSSRVTNYNYIIKADYYDYEMDSQSKESGMYAAEDDEGTSYYLRGQIDNNYVSFANTIWRVVRINGDGSIRLIANEMVTNKEFNTNYDSPQYVGYTYNNTSSCTKSSPCISTYNITSGKFINNKNGTNSTIKEYLENDYYKNNLLAYDNLIVQGSYCNDTTYTISNNYNYYGSYNRVKAGTPSLKCADTNELYGGYYKSKIGLISSDELDIAGYSLSEPHTNSNNYLYHSYWFWSVSPYYFLTDAYVSSGVSGYIDVDYDVSDNNCVVPVINLKSDILITSGNGTSSSPYVVSAS